MPESGLSITIFAIWPGAITFKVAVPRTLPNESIWRALITFSPALRPTPMYSQP